MEDYTEISYQLCEQLTRYYSSSFGLSSTLFDKKIRNHIYAIYGLVRIADEIVDTYRGADMQERLTALKQETALAGKTGYSTSPIVQAFAATARTYTIPADLTEPFFASMATDIDKKSFTQREYDTYIYGSAAVVGLMCLKVFVQNDTKEYEKLKPSATALGNAYQKVNFLRDMAADYHTRNRFYFPGTTFATFGEKEKTRIVSDIASEFAMAKPGIAQLPLTARKAVQTSSTYYTKLLSLLEKTPVETIKTKRLSVPAYKKVSSFLRAKYL